ncbi:Hypothetical protein FKW44_005979 [Caligus rogercresseyi]|uniref:Uncharacterized protein n=1 Tax=Caligus rogercresseyi TaxID=217165 RepID=A0A7T8KCN6_CALRO|nr:Hypothetical protein FKW44_005979 [Caligus rogercresseyi]
MVFQSAVVPAGGAVIDTRLGLQVNPIGIIVFLAVCFIWGVENRAPVGSAQTCLRSAESQ